MLRDDYLAFAQFNHSDEKLYIHLSSSLVDLRITESIQQVVL